MSSIDPQTIQPQLTAFRYQLRFEKRGDLAWIGHQDLMRVLERLIRRVSIPVAHSQGFNPRPKINLVQALGLGIEALNEVLEIELTEPYPGPTLVDSLNSHAPNGLRFLSAITPPGRRAARARSLTYLFNTEIPMDSREAVGLRMEELLAATQHIVERRREDNVVTLNLRPLIHSIDWSEDGHVRMCLRVTPEATARPEEVLTALGLKHLYTTGTLIRLDLILEETTPSSTEPSVLTDQVSAS